MLSPLRHLQTRCKEWNINLPLVTQNTETQAITVKEWKTNDGGLFKAVGSCTVKDPRATVAVFRYRQGAFRTLATINLDMPPSRSLTTALFEDNEPPLAAAPAPAADHNELSVKNKRIRELQAQVIALRDVIECGSEEEF